MFGDNPFGDNPGQAVSKQKQPQQWGIFCLIFGLGILLISCSSPSSLFSSSPTNRTIDRTSSASALDSGVTSTADSTVESTQSPKNQADLGQVLPISAQAEIGGQIIQLEVAETPHQQALGLMYRTELADDRGMLFPFNPPRRVSFWMKNVSISLDMIFLFQGAVVAIAADVPPCTSAPCDVYGPGGRQLVDQVIELRGGRAAELDIQVDGVITINPLDSAASVSE